MQWDPPFGSLRTLVLALCVGSAVLGLYATWLRSRSSRLRRLFWLRAAVVLLLIGILLNPLRSNRPRFLTEKPPFILLLDTSRSMKVPDVPGADGKTLQTRWEAAQRLTLQDRSLLDTLRQRYTLHLARFDSRLIAQSAETLAQLRTPDGPQTSLGAALRQAMGVQVFRRSGVQENAPTPDAPVPIQNPKSKIQNPLIGGILLVSDGRDNGGEFPQEAAREARQRGLAVYTLGLGRTRQGQDVQVVVGRTQVFAAPRQTIGVNITLRTQGLTAPAARLDLLREGKRVETRTVALRPGEQSLSFSVQDAQTGVYRYTVALAPVPGETNPTNNRASFFLNVMEARARVLLLEGRPSWDAKFLTQALRADPTVQVDSLFRLTADQTYAVTDTGAKLTPPRTLADFARYEVVVLGKGVEPFLEGEAAAALKQWVSEKGGNLVLLRGQPDERLAALREMEPVTFGAEEVEAGRTQLTEAGRTYPGFTFSTGDDAQTVVQQLPNLVAATRIQQEKALTVVLARATGEEMTDSRAEMALLAYQRFGQGKVMAVIGQGLWRWAFLPPEQERFRGAYGEFWTQTIRWLVSETEFLPGQNLALRTDRAAYSFRDPVTIFGFRRSTPGTQATSPPPTLLVTQPDGSQATLTTAPGERNGADFRATFRPPLPGEYIVSLQSGVQDSPIQNPKSKIQNPKFRTPIRAVFTVYPAQEEEANLSADLALMAQIAASGGGEALEPSELAALPEKLHAAERASLGPEEVRTLWDSPLLLLLLLALLASEWILRRRHGLT